MVGDRILAGDDMYSCPKAFGAVFSGEYDGAAIIALRTAHAAAGGTVAALHRAGNVNVSVAGKTPLSDWRRIDR